MFRFLSCLLFSWGFATGASAQVQVTLAMDHLRLAELIEIVRSEGIDCADSLDTDMLNGQDGPVWAEQIDTIYNIQLMSEIVRNEIATLPEDQLRQINQFYSGLLGVDIVELEMAARAAMQHIDIKNLAVDSYQIALAEGPQSVENVLTINDAGQFIDRNVTATLTPNYKFYLGLVDGGAFEASVDEVIEQTWAQESEIRRDTTNWMMGYLLLSYQPLDDSEIATLVAFTQTQAGRALNAAIFEGFGSMYADISYALGRAIALNMVASDL